MNIPGVATEQDTHSNRPIGRSVHKQSHLTQLWKLSTTNVSYSRQAYGYVPRSSVTTEIARDADNVATTTQGHSWSSVVVAIDAEYMTSY